MPPHLSSNQTNQKTPTHKKHRKTHKILTILAFSGFSWRLFWSSCASPRALAAILEPADTLCGRPQSLSDLSWAAWSPFWRPLGPSWARPGGPWRPFGGPKKISECSFFTSPYPSSISSAVSGTFGCPFRLFSQPLGALWGRFSNIVGLSGAVLAPPSHEIHDPKRVGRRCRPPQGRSVKCQIAYGCCRTLPASLY